MVYSLGNFARNNNQTARSLKSFKQRIHISCNKKAFRWQNNYSTCVNLRKLTKEFYVRFVFGIIVTTCIKFPSLLAKDHTHTHTKPKGLNSAFATHTHIVRTRLILLAVCRGLVWKVPGVFLCYHWEQRLKFLISLGKLSSDDLWIKWKHSVVMI